MTRALPILVSLVLLAACGQYRIGAGYRDDIDTVAVPIFQNDTFQPGIETRLTTAILHQLETTTDWTTAPRSTADTELRGTVTDVTLTRLVNDPDSGLGQQMATTVEVSFEWTDRRTGEVLVSRRNFRGSGFFVPAVGSREPIEIGQNDAVSLLARDIVAELRASW